MRAFERDVLDNLDMCAAIQEHTYPHELHSRTASWTSCTLDASLCCMQAMDPADGCLLHIWDGVLTLALIVTTTSQDAIMLCATE